MLGLLIASAVGLLRLDFAVPGWGFAFEPAAATGEVAAKAVELLNAVTDQAFVPVLKSPGEQTGCMSCHTAGTDYAVGQWTQGKMNCTSCHVTPAVKQHAW